LIRNSEGAPLPATFTGELASGYLIHETEQIKRRNLMKTICRSCHSTDWSNGFFEQLDATIAETDKMILTATEFMQEAWDMGLADASNPFL